MQKDGWCWTSTLLLFYAGDSSSLKDHLAVVLRVNINPESKTVME